MQRYKIIVYVGPRFKRMIWSWPFSLTEKYIRMWIWVILKKWKIQGFSLWICNCCPISLSWVLVLKICIYWSLKYSSSDSTWGMRDADGAKPYAVRRTGHHGWTLPQISDSRGMQAGVSCRHTLCSKDCSLFSLFWEIGPSFEAAQIFEWPEQLATRTYSPAAIQDGKLFHLIFRCVKAMNVVWNTVGYFVEKYNLFMSILLQTTMWLVLVCRQQTTTDGSGLASYTTSLAPWRLPTVATASSKRAKVKNQLFCGKYRIFPHRQSSFWKGAEYPVDGAVQSWSCSPSQLPALIYKTHNMMPSPGVSLFWSEW